LADEHNAVSLLCWIHGRRRGADRRNGLGGRSADQERPAAGALPIVAPISWTGFYASLEGGYAWDGTIVYIGPWNKGFGDTGVFGGANVGYNYQIGSFVIGAQAGYDFANARGNAYAYPYNVSANIDGFGSIDARAGFAFGSALIYAIGGFSMGDVKHTIEPVWSYSSLSYSSWQDGWDLGVGLAYQFTPNISGFAEFRKYNWGKNNFSDLYYPYHSRADPGRRAGGCDLQLRRNGRRNAILTELMDATRPFGAAPPLRSA
jgi:outer membrane immunogenic protein